MLIIAGTLTSEKPVTEDVMEACRKMIVATHEENGCIDYVFSVDPIDPKILHVYERWEDQESLDAISWLHTCLPFVRHWQVGE